MLFLKVHRFASQQFFLVFYQYNPDYTDVKEAIQWLYFAYLSAVKDQNGAAMSIGRISTFLDIYAEQDLKSGKYSESQIQEFVDHFIMKLRIVRFLRTGEYDFNLFCNFFTVSNNFFGESFLFIFF